jgi:hypothetical protein
MDFGFDTCSSCGKEKDMLIINYNDMEMILKLDAIPADDATNHIHSSKKTDKNNHEKNDVWKVSIHMKNHTSPLGPSKVVCVIYN